VIDALLDPHEATPARISSATAPIPMRGDIS